MYHLGKANKGKINKWNYMKSFCRAKETIIRMKSELTLWENIFVTDILDKGLISNIYEELKDSTPGSQIIQLN